MTKTTRSSSRPDPALAIDLALQGGGSHGAFTWGVLDRLLEEPGLRIDGISGTSAGAMNAVVLAHGHLQGGADGAKEALDTFWRKVSEAALLSPFKRSFLDVLTGRWTLDNSPVFVAMDMAARIWSPYNLNPRGANPLGDLLDEMIDFDALDHSSIQLFVTATNVRTGRARVFRNAELSTGALMASACLPTLFQAIEIDGDPYWDGGYAGNPTISPLVRECDANDIVLVQINPVERPGVPRTAAEIQNRLNEVSFNSPLLKELRMIALLRQVSDPGHAEGALWARMRMHRIATDAMLKLGYSSKMIAEWAFLCELRDEGRKAANDFLRSHGADLGVRSSMDLDALMEGV